MGESKVTNGSGTPGISADIRHMICDDYTRQIKDKMRERGFPLGLRIFYPERDPIHMIFKDVPGAQENFETTIDNMQLFAFACHIKGW